MVATAKATTDYHISNEFFLAYELRIHEKILPDRPVQHTCSEVVPNTLQNVLDCLCPIVLNLQTSKRLECPCKRQDLLSVNFLTLTGCSVTNSCHTVTLTSDPDSQALNLPVDLSTAKLHAFELLLHIKGNLPHLLPCLFYHLKSQYPFITAL